MAGTASSTSSAVIITRPYQEVIALDPTFWQALGKSLGWKTTIADDGMEATDVWSVEAHRFYNIILEGQNTEAFWDELLAK
jgi:hypothetical protein